MYTHTHTHAHAHTHTPTRAHAPMKDVASFMDAARQRLHKDVAEIRRRRIMTIIMYIINYIYI